MGVPNGLHAKRAFAEYLGSLLGADVRWWRLKSWAFSVEEAPRVNQKTSTVIETGPAWW